VTIDNWITSALAQVSSDKSAVVYVFVYPREGPSGTARGRRFPAGYWVIDRGLLTSAGPSSTIAV